VYSVDLVSEPSVGGSVRVGRGRSDIVPEQSARPSTTFTRGDSRKRQPVPLAAPSLL
jgi:hypothetical protein